MKGWPSRKNLFLHNTYFLPDLIASMGSGLWVLAKLDRYVWLSSVEKSAFLLVDSMRVVQTKLRSTRVHSDCYVASLLGLLY